VGRGGDPSIVTETENTKHVDGVIEEAWNEGNLAVIDEAIAADYELHVPNAPKEFHGPDGFKEFVRMYRNAFPDLTLSVEDRVVEGDKIADRIETRGTHEGELYGLVSSITGDRRPRTGDHR